MVTRQIVSEKLLAYLDDQLSFNQIIAWANQVMREGNFTSDSNIERLVGIVMSLAGADSPRLLNARADFKNPMRALAKIAPSDAA